MKNGFVHVLVTNYRLPCWICEIARMIKFSLEGLRSPILAVAASAILAEDKVTVGKSLTAWGISRRERYAQARDEE